MIEPDGKVNSLTESTNVESNFSAHVFQKVKVAVLRANASSVKEVIAAYKEGKLQELTEGCRHLAILDD